jgi:hypothetical protein
MKTLRIADDQMVHLTRALLDAEDAAESTASAWFPPKDDFERRMMQQGLARLRVCVDLQERCWQALRRVPKRRAAR